MSTEDLYQDDVESLDEETYEDHAATEHDQPHEGEQHWPETDHEAHHDSEAEPLTEADPPAFAALALDLTLRCGELKLSLGELRRLGTGTILEVSGIAAGHATLCHGDQVLAEGELVDVDGRLGLQITRLAGQP